MRNYGGQVNQLLHSNGQEGAFLMRPHHAEAPGKIGKTHLKAKKIKSYILSVFYKGSGSHLDLIRAPYGLYGVQYMFNILAWYPLDPLRR